MADLPLYFLKDKTSLGLHLLVNGSQQHTGMIIISFFYWKAVSALS